jgi:hypothetical protein
MVSVGWVIGQFPIMWKLLPHLIAGLSVSLGLFCAVKFMRILVGYETGQPSKNNPPPVHTGRRISVSGQASKG